MDPKLKAAYDRLAAALEAVEAAGEAITQFNAEDAGDDAEATLTGLRESFDAKLAAHAAAKADYDRVKATADARANLPVSPSEGAPRVSVTDEPLTYDRRSGHSFFADLYARDTRHDSKAAARLERHMEEYRVERPEAFDLSSTDSAGGYLVAPIYLQDQFVDLATASRVAANLIGARSLPPNTDSINIPKLSSGTSVGDQADNAPVSETDATFGTIAADVKTKAGMQDASQQLVDRSVPGIDDVIFADLAKRYAVAVDQMVISSATANNLGLLNAGGNLVTYTDASPTVGELYPKFADGIQQVHGAVYASPNVILMHPRRWAMILGAVDSQGRPLVLPGMAMNPAAVLRNGNGEPIAEGFTGYVIQGVPVYLDANIPTNLGAGTNEDRIIITRTDELLLWEDLAGPYLETFRDVLSGQLGVRFRLHNYVAQMNVRRPAATSVIAGTGLVTPTF